MCGAGSRSKSIVVDRRVARAKGISRTKSKVLFSDGVSGDRVTAIEAAFPGKQLDRVLDEIEEAPGIVLFTLLEKDLVQRLEAKCKDINLPSLTTPSPTISVSWIASCFRMANISSCLRIVLAFSTPFSSANRHSSRVAA
jgi:hypothetical protein